MAIQAYEQTNIVTLVTAMFNTAPSAATLTWLAASYEANGRSLAKLADMLAGTTDFANIYAGKVTNDAIATQLAASFGLTKTSVATDVGTQAYNYFMDGLTAGKSKQALLLEAATFLKTTTDTAWATAKNTLVNKATVAEYYATTAQGSTNSSSILTGVTADTATVTAATTSASNVSGSSFTLTTGTDVITGTANSDTIVGTDASYTTGDQINGGAGSADKLQLILGGANTAIVTLANVENVEISDYSGVTVNGAQWSGVTGLTFKSSTSATTVNNLTAIPATVTLDGVSAGVTVTMAAAAVAGASDSIGLVYKGVSSAMTTTLAGIETINVTATGSNSNAAALTLTAANVKTLNVAGDKSLDLSGAAITTATKVDASAMTAGGVKLNLAGATLTSVTGGAGDDTFLLGATAVGTTVINGGAGTDTLGLNIANVAGALVTTSAITNIETLKIQNANTLTAAETIALGNVTGLTNLTYGALLTTDLGTTNSFVETINGLVSGSTVRFDAGTANTGLNGETAANRAGGIVANVTGAAASTTDVLNIVMAKGASGAAAEALEGITVANVETINFNVKSLAGATTTIDAVYDAQLSTVKFSSSALSSGAAADAADLTVAGTDAFNSTIISTVDLSGYQAATAGVVNVAGLSTSLIATGATITGPAKGILIATGGAGADTIITGVGGSNSGTGLTGGLGADTYNLSASTAKADIISVASTHSTTTAMDTVIGFTMSATVGDKLDITDTTVAANVAAGTVTTVANLTGQISSGIITFGGTAASTATLTQLIQGAEDLIGANAKVAAFVYNGDTYLVDNVDNSATVTAADTVIKLAGLTTETSVSTSMGAAAIYIA